MPLQLETASSATAAKPHASLLAPRRLAIAAASRMMTNASRVHSGRWTPGCWRNETGGAMVRSVVVMLPAEDEDPFAARVTPVGDNAQVAPTGAPVHVSATVPVKPLVELRVAVNVALPPAVTVAVVGVAVRVKSGVPLLPPTPVSATVCGLVASLSIMLRV